MASEKRCILEQKMAITDLARHSAQVIRRSPLLAGRNGLKKQKRIHVNLGLPADPERKEKSSDRGEIRPLAIAVNLAGCHLVAGPERDRQCREDPKFRPRFLVQESQSTGYLVHCGNGTGIPIVGYFLLYLTRPLVGNLE